MNGQLPGSLVPVSQVYSDWQEYTTVVNNMNAPTGNPTPDTYSVSNPGPFRPPQWAKLCGIKTNLASTDSNNVVTSWYFDAVFSENHSTQSTITQHPVQTGASISDHAYMMPATVTLEIGMSDAMVSFAQGQWGSQQGRSINAYQQLMTWQQSRTVLELNTNLNIYENMLIEQVVAPRDNKTMTSLKATVTLKQIMVATTANITAVSSDDMTQTATPPSNQGNQPVTPVTVTAPTASTNIPTVKATQQTSFANILTKQLDNGDTVFMK
jgi:hypothetical protein